MTSLQKLLVTSGAGVTGTTTGIELREAGAPSRQA